MSNDQTAIEMGCTHKIVPLVANIGNTLYGSATILDNITGFGATPDAYELIELVSEFDQEVIDTTNEIEDSRSAMGEGFDKDIAEDIIERNGVDHDKNEFRDAVFYHIGHFFN